MFRPMRLAFASMALLACSTTLYAAQKPVYQFTDATTFFANSSSEVTQLCSWTDSCTSDPGCCDVDCCGEGCGDCCLGAPWKLDSNDNGINFGGWFQMGYTSGSTGMFNNIPHKFNLHQGWLYAEKVADGSRGTDWGFRADIMYGIDSADTQAFGNNPGRWDFINGWDFGGTYGYAMPQLYAEVANGDLSVKLGHFYTLLGYEVVTAPDNFFFSHAYTMYNSEAFTHTGALATYQASDNVTAYAGWTLGWDTGFDQFRGGSNFIGGFSASLSDSMTMTYISTAGDMGVRGTGYSHSIVFDVAVTDKLNYVLQSDMVRFKNFGGINDEVGINQYLIYNVSDKIGVGTRFEWWKNEGKSQYASTLGVNIKPMDNVILRPEIRHDWMLNGPNESETTFGMDDWYFH